MSRPFTSGSNPYSRREAAASLRRLVDESQHARSVWTPPFGRRVADISGADSAMQRAAEVGLLDDAATGSTSRRIDCGRYFSRLATREQLVSDRIGSLNTCVAPLALTRRRAEALGAAMTECMRYSVGTILPGLAASFWIALDVEDDCLILALAVRGDFGVMASAAPTRSLMRAIEIVRLLGGRFQRGIDEQQMVFGITFDRAAMQCRRLPAGRSDGQYRSDDAS